MVVSGNRVSELCCFDRNALNKFEATDTVDGNVTNKFEVTDEFDRNVSNKFEAIDAFERNVSIELFETFQAKNSTRH